MVRPLPWRLITPLIVIALLQTVWRLQTPRAEPVATSLEPPPSVAVLRLTTLNDPIVASLSWGIRLQTFDQQPGLQLPLRTIDPERLIAWLERLLALDPHAGLPLDLALKIHGFVPDPARQRRMLDFIHQAFLENPAQRWPWLARAASVARHRLNDNRLARYYLNSLESHLEPKEIPFWVDGLHARILEELGEPKEARNRLAARLERGGDTPAQQRAMRIGMERLRTATGEE
ncbi:hypothetical protein SIID45300_01336 [Candidatus Magnetaquicoccaceae bacterium FCR-1]|uniref:Uncharacterized protein n=1 Tax=Candidatus Magnetaquiglobus chichijimensis TaxID=3141448 RepID=A0ABQ0C805_9PROT